MRDEDMIFLVKGKILVFHQYQRFSVCLVSIIIWIIMIWSCECVMASRFPGPGTAVVTACLTLPRQQAPKRWRFCSRDYRVAMDHETCLARKYWVLNVTLLIVSLYLRICIVKSGTKSNCRRHQNQPSLFPICGATTCSEYWVSLSLTKEADHEGFIIFLFSKQCFTFQLFK